MDDQQKSFDFPVFYAIIQHMKIEKLIRGVNRSINLCKTDLPHISSRANQIIKGILCSSQSPDVFGDFFGSRSVYTYTKKLIPYCTIGIDSTGAYIKKLQFGTRDIDIDEPTYQKITRLNYILENLNYDEFRYNDLIDLTAIEKIKF